MADKKKRAQKALVKLWRRLLKEGKKEKKRFNDDAAEALKFYDGPHEHMYDESELLDWDNWPRVTINKTAEVVRILGPALYHKNPVRTVNTNSDDPAKNAFAKVLEEYLNYTPNEANPTLKDEARKAIDEALIKGRGCLWTGYDEETGLVTSEWVSIDDILIDPDARDHKMAKWVARRRIEPVWMLKEIFPDAADELDEYVDSLTSKIEKETVNQYIQTYQSEYEDEVGSDDRQKRKGVTADLVVYWEVFSKMGVGFRATGVPEELREVQDSIDEKHIIIAEGLETPLHIGDWPAPLFLDNEWYHTFLDFVPKPNEVWPLAYMKPAMGEQKAMNVLASLMLAKAKNNSRELMGVKGHIGEENLEKIREGADREVLVLDSSDPGESIDSLVSFLQIPPMTPDLMNQFRLHLELFEARTGLGELLYGQTRNQMRSAREAEIKDRNSRLRVEDMAFQVEDWMTRVARKEAILARFLLEPADVQLAIGAKNYGWAVDIVMQGRMLSPQEVAQVFPPAAGYLPDEAEAQTLAASINTTGIMQAMAVPVTPERVWRDSAKVDSKTIVREYQIRIEATSARRPDRNWQIDQADFVLQNVAVPSMQMGQVDNYNKCLELMYEAMEIPPQRRVFLESLPPQMPGGQASPVSPNITPDQGLSELGPLASAEAGIIGG